MPREDKLWQALELLREWMDKGHDFWPKEEAIQGWFCAALREAGFVDHPLQIVQEVHLGEKEPKDDLRGNRKRIEDDVGSADHVRYDVVAFERAVTGDVRNLESTATSPMLVAEVKSLNAAGGLCRSTLKRDLYKLSIAKDYLRSKPDEGKDTIALLLIVATACKGIREKVKNREKVKSFVKLLTSWDSPEEIAPNVIIRMVLRNGVTQIFP